MGVTRREFCRWGVAGAAAGLAGRAGAASAESRVAALAEEFLRAHGMPGLSVAYLKGTEFRLQAAYGHADLNRKERMTPQHRFRIASLSKPLTAAVVLELAFSGRLAVDGRVFGPNGLLGSVASPADGGRWLDQITVDHLLSHRSGGWTNEDQPDPVFISRYLGLDQADLIAATLSDMPVRDEPGTRFAYSNFGYVLLGRVIEAVTGQPYAAAVWETLLFPAGVEGFEIGQDAVEDRKPDEVSYFSTEGDPYELRIARMDAAGGWIASPGAYVRVLAAMDGKRSPPDVVNGKTVAWMAKPGEPGAYYGRGLAVSPDHGNRWHGGSLPGVTTFAVMDDGGEVFAGFVNGRGPNVEADLEGLLWQIFDVLNA